MDDEATHSAKGAKQDFVSGHSGSSVAEIVLVLAVGLAAYAVRRTASIGATPSLPRDLLLDFFLFLIPLQLSATLATDSLTPLLTLFALQLSTLALLVLKARNTPPERHAAEKSPQQPRPTYISAFRACMQLLTICCILAVDFTVFPRRYAKTESFGTSLMDLGVGGFVFSMGLVSSRKLVVSHDSLHSTWSVLVRSIRSAAMVLALGIARLLATKAVDYQEHVSEYGAHWNFFFTLGFLPISISLLLLLVRPLLPPSFNPPKFPFAVVGGAVLVVYQFWLQSGGTQYILHAPRDTLLNANREGVFSFFGYLSIFLIAADIGARLLDTTTTTPPWTRLRGILLTTSTALAAVSVLGGVQVSRRMANASYVLWVIITNTGVLFVFHIIETYLMAKQMNPVTKKAADANNETRSTDPWLLAVFAAVNRNQLATFLVANLFTGLVNLSTNTLLADPPTATAILAAYMAAVAGIAVFLDRGLDVTLKI